MLFCNGCHKYYDDNIGIHNIQPWFIVQIQNISCLYFRFRLQLTAVVEFGLCRMTFGYIPSRLYIILYIYEYILYIYVKLIIIKYQMNLSYNSINKWYECHECQKYNLILILGVDDFIIECNTKTRWRFDIPTHPIPNYLY